MKTITLILIFGVILATGCKTSEPRTSIERNTSSSYEEYQRMYSLEHRLIPRFLFSDNGEFFNELASNGDSFMPEFWSDVVGPSRASEIIIEYEVYRTDLSIAFITFPTPPMPVACYHAAVIRSGDMFRYITLEMTHDISGEGYLSAFCEWTREGSHLNLGPRKYKDLESFKGEVVRDYE